MKFLFYIASLVCVSSVPISSVPERQMNRSVIGLRKDPQSKWAYESNPFDGYMVVAQDRWCNGNADSYLSGTDEITHASCNRACATRTSCNYYLWRHDDTAAEPYTCATYEKCGITQPFTDGHGGFIYKKLTSTNFVLPTYVVSSSPIPSTDLVEENDLLSSSYEIGSSSNPCGSGCTLAMPRTSLERDAISALFPDATTAANQAWGGTYVWLGGHWNYSQEEWYWNDGTQISQKNWDTNEPGHDESLDKNSGSNAEQPFLGLKRSNGKWHDFHGNDQGSNGQEETQGQQGVCESVKNYQEEATDTYCCGSNCADTVILDTHCLRANQHCGDDSTTALWGNRENCERSCSNDPECNFYLWRHDQSGDVDAPFTCATFKNCDTKTAFNDGHGGKVWKKL